MRVTYRQDPKDPGHPFMHGKDPIAKEFNKREAVLWEKSQLKIFDFEQVATVLLEMFAEDYNERHKAKAKAKKVNKK